MAEKAEKHGYGSLQMSKKTYAQRVLFVIIQRDRDRDRDRQTDTDTDTDTETQTETVRQTDTETDRQRQTDRQIDRQTQRQTDRDRKREREREGGGGGKRDRKRDVEVGEIELSSGYSSPKKSVSILNSRSVNIPFRERVGGGGGGVLGGPGRSKCKRVNLEIELSSGYSSPKKSVSILNSRSVNIPFRERESVCVCGGEGGC